jgi:hypothetical protein
MGRRLSADERAVLEGRREQLLELRLIEAQLRSDEALRLQDGEHERAAGERLRLRGVGGVGAVWRGSVFLPLGLRRSPVGIASLNSSTRLPASSVTKALNPVTLPPGRGRLATTPESSGSPIAAAVRVSTSRRTASCARLCCICSRPVMAPFGQIDQLEPKSADWGEAVISNAVR